MPRRSVFRPVFLVLLMAFGLPVVQGCGGPGFGQREYVRQGATGLEVELPDAARRVGERFGMLLGTMEALLEDDAVDGERFLGEVTSFIVAHGDALREDTLGILRALGATQGPERRALEEQLGRHFGAHNDRWQALRARIARQHPAHANAVFQRVIQLNPAA